MSSWGSGIWKATIINLLVTAIFLKGTLSHHRACSFPCIWSSHTHLTEHISFLPLIPLINMKPHCFFHLTNSSFSTARTYKVSLEGTSQNHETVTRAEGLLTSEEKFWAVQQTLQNLFWVWGSGYVCDLCIWRGSRTENPSDVQKHEAANSWEEGKWFQLSDHTLCWKKFSFHQHIIWSPLWAKPTIKMQAYGVQQTALAASGQKRDVYAFWA